MKLYKITDKDGKTRTGRDNECQWGEGITHKANGEGRELCSDGFIHAYTDPLLAVFFNPIGGSYDEKTMQLWEAKGRVVAKAVDKVGCKSLTTIKQIEKPEITTEQRCIIAIKLALKVYKDKDFVEWAGAWLENRDRTEAAAGAAARTAAGAAWAAARAARAAAGAAWAAAGAARAAARTAAGAAWAAARTAARAAARTAAGAAWAGENIDVLAVIKEVVYAHPHSKG